MQRLKRLSLLKSFRSKIIVTAVLIVLAGGIFLLSKLINKSKTPDTDKQFLEQLNDEKTGNNTSIDINVLSRRCDRDIDSILYNFGIKKEWISTVYSGEKNQPQKQDKSSKQPVTKREASSVKWFTKTVSIPKDLTTTEVNLDLSGYVKYLGLPCRVDEDIRTTAINFKIDSPEDTSADKIPLAAINIIPTDKIKRDGGILVLIVNQISNFKKEQLESILNTANEFSFIFPRNPEEIELQNKLLQLKKDVLVNLTVGTADNYDADFRIGMDDKEIKQKVKSITSDFPTVKTAIISKINPQVPNDMTFNLVADEFRKNGIKTYRDTILTRPLSKDEEDSDNKIQLLVQRLQDKSVRAGSVIAILNLSNDEFVSFYNEVQNLKKRGFKFYSFTAYMDRLQQKEEKENQQKEADSKKEAKKENPKKKEVKKEVKKETGKETKKDTKKTTKPKQTKTDKNKKKK